jgi:hypothetical protein
MQEEGKVLLLWNYVSELRIWSFGNFDRHTCFITIYIHLGSLPRNFIYRSLIHGMMATPAVHRLLSCSLGQSNGPPLIAHASHIPPRNMSLLVHLIAWIMLTFGECVTVDSSALMMAFTSSEWLIIIGWLVDQIVIWLSDRFIMLLT